MREGFQVTNNQVILLYVLADGEDKEIKRLKATQSGVVKKRLHKDGDVVPKGYVLISKRKKGAISYLHHFLTQL